MVLEWVLTNPAQGPQFLSRVGSDPNFRKTFLGHYHDVEGVMRRLGADPTPPPMFFLEKIQKSKQDLEREQRTEAIGARQTRGLRQRGARHLSPGYSRQGLQGGHGGINRFQQPNPSSTVPAS